MKETRSLQEKKVLTLICERQPELPFPLRVVTSEEFKDESFYDIPEDKQEEVIKQLWPFQDMPNIDADVYDIHEDAMTTLRKCKVIRFAERNMVVSEHYFKSGGMCIDLISGDDDPSFAIAKLTLK